MSISTSKSKTQLAYARTSKAVNKPKNKNITQIQTNDLTKSKNPARNSTGNIYDSIMGQIDTSQQDYIKSLIVKNQKETIKNQKTTLKQPNKITHQNNDKKKTLQPQKSNKQQEPAKKVFSLQSHERTRSQAELQKQPSGHQLTQSQIKVVKIQQKQNTEVSSISEQQIEQLKESQVKVDPQQEKKRQQSILNNSDAGKLSYKPTNPIIEAINNTSSSFAKKIEAFQLEYPSEQRQQRSTHKKGGSKLPGDYASCQTSPKNNIKNIYTREVVLTTKPEQHYNLQTRNQYSSVKISPVSTGKIPIQKTNEKNTTLKQQLSTNFISCLDQYLQALKINLSQSQEINYSSNGKKMKRSDSTKIKEFSASKNQFYTYTMEKQDEEQQTIVLQNSSNQRANHSKSNQGRVLSLVQQNNLIKQLQKEKKKVYELKSIIDLFSQELTKYKKKQKKMKQNQYHMIQCLKSLNQELTQEKKQRRKLEEVVKDFQEKIRGISRNDKKRRQSIQEQQRVQRKTIYGSNLIPNNIQYSQQMSHSYKGPEIFYNLPEKTPSKMHSKNNSASRFCSTMNAIPQNYPKNNHQGEYQNFYIEQKPILNEGFGKNRTKKFSKIISSFELQNQQMEEEQINFKLNKMQNSMRNPYQPNSAKNSYINVSSTGSKHTRSRPMTPKLIQQLFKGNKIPKKSQNFQYNHNQSGLDDESQSQNQQSSPEYLNENFREAGDQQEYDSEEQQPFNPMSNSDDGYESQRNYGVNQSDVLIRMR